MLETYSNKAVKILEYAKKLAQEYSEVTNSPLFVSSYYLLESLFIHIETICHFLLDEKDITIDDITSAYSKVCVKEELGSKVFSKQFEEIVSLSEQIASRVNSEYVYDEHIFTSILEYPSSIAKEILINLGFDINSLKEDVEDIFNFNNEEDEVKLSITTNSLSYLSNLSILPKRSDYINYSNNIDKVVRILNKLYKNSVLLIGASGVGKSSLVQEVSFMYKKNYNKDIYMLDLGSLVSGTKYRGELEEKVIRAIDYVKSVNGILFIDEIHNIVGTGSNEGSLDFANMLKPYLSNNDIQVIGATTKTEYYKYFESDEALCRRFQLVYIDEASIDECIKIMINNKKYFEKHYNTKISNKVITNLVKRVKKLFPNKVLPDMPKDILDESLSYRNIHKTSIKSSIDKVLISRLGLCFKEDNINSINIYNKFLIDIYYSMKNNILSITKRSTNNIKVVYVDNNFNINLFASDIYNLLGIKSESIIMLSSSDYYTKEQLSDLTGSSKGYVGYNDGGLLYNHILKNCISIIYIKNYSKTYPLYYFIKDLISKDHVIDSHGRYISLINTLYILEEDNDCKNVVGY